MSVGEEHEGAVERQRLSTDSDVLTSQVTG